MSRIFFIAIGEKEREAFQSGVGFRSYASLLKGREWKEFCETTCIFYAKCGIERIFHFPGRKRKK